MAATAQDYEAVAAILAEEMESVTEPYGYGVLANIGYALADHFAQTNPRFDRDRFLRATGLLPSSTNLGPTYDEALDALRTRGQ